MSKYTKGPWVIDWYGCTSGNGKTHWRVPRSIGPISPDHNHWSGPYLDVEEPDAYLIAAAPDLLEALEAITAALKLIDELNAQGYRVLSISDSVLRRAEKALAKAKGE